MFCRPKLEKGHRRPADQQCGAVIVVALFVVALVVTMAYAMMSRLEKDTWRTRLLLRNTEAEYYAQGSLAWAIDQINENWRQQKPGQWVDVLPLSSPVDVMQGHRISSTIYDMQARFNLNNLNDSSAKQAYKRLLRFVLPKLEERTVDELVKATVDWMTPSTTLAPYGRYYAEQTPPYRPAHRFFLSVDELALVKGMSPDFVQRLRPFLCALPVQTRVNAHTALAQVLAALSPTVDLATAKAIIEVCQRAKPTTLQAFLNLDLVHNHGLPAESMTMVSSYFLVKTKVDSDDQRLILYTLLERAVQGDRSIVKALWQSKNTW